MDKTIANCLMYLYVYRGMSVPLLPSSTFVGFLVFQKLLPGHFTEVNTNYNKIVTEMYYIDLGIKRHNNFM